MMDLRCGDALIELKKIPDESVDCCITSPPYWALRDYGVEGQLGLEPTFQEYITKLCDIFDEVKRVLKKEGTCWVNIGDTYFGGGNNKGSSPENLSDMQRGNRGAQGQVQQDWSKMDYSDKCLCLISFRFAIEMVNRGWILRNTIIWHKRNCMPSSVKDRFTVDFEYVFFMVKSKKYYFEQQYVSAKQCSIERLSRAVSNKNKWVKGADGQTPHNLSQPRPNRNTKIPKEIAEKMGSPRVRYHRYKGGDNIGRENNCAISTYQFEEGDYLVSPFDPTKGRNMRCVWNITTKGYKGAHFAVFPEALVEPMIKAGCPQGGVILDPFAGSFTTLVAAKKLRRQGIGIDLNPAYCEMGKKRLDNTQESMF